MRICLFAEGSYPYVQGGVSSWIHTFIRECPEHEFVILSIGPDSSVRGQYKYELAKNVVGVRDFFLDNISIIAKSKGKKYRFSDQENRALKALLTGDAVSWHEIFAFFHKIKSENVADIFLSKNFFDMIKDVYREKYPYTPFTEFLWSMRSMYLTLFYVLMQDLPEADLYHSVSTGYSGVLAGHAKFIYNKPFILSEHGIYTREREEEIIKANWVKGYYKDLWISYFYNLSNCAYTLSDAVTVLFNRNKEIQVELGCPEEKILLIPNGVDISKFENIPKKTEDGFVNIGAILRIAPIKDVKTMLLAFKRVQKEVAHTHFYIFGPYDEDKEYAKECFEMAEKLEINHLHFTGSIDILEHIGKMDILVLTSISEGQPLSVLEGMAAKKPHVCTNVGDCKDLLYGYNDHYGQAGFITHVLDHKGIAKSIIELCNNKDLRYEMGQNAYSRVANLYQKESYITKYKALYQQFGSV